MIHDVVYQKAFDILKNKNITYSQYTPFYQPDYNHILKLWKNYRFLNKKHFSIEDDYVLKNLFSFHLNEISDHGILYYASNSKNAVIFYKIDDKFFTIKVDAEYLGTKDKNIIAIYV